MRGFVWVPPLTKVQCSKHQLIAMRLADTVKDARSRADVAKHDIKFLIDHRGREYFITKC